MMTVDEALNHAQNELESAFEKWLSDECPSGDCESVQRQWDESFVHQELVDELRPVMALTWEVRRLRECLDKANTSAEHFEREWYLRGDEIDRVRAVLTSAQIDCKQWERHYKELREENERLRKDAERWRYFIGRGEWFRHDHGTPDAHALLAIRLPYTADLSCKAMCEFAIDAARGAK